MADVQAGGSDNTGQATIGNSKKLTKEEAFYREDQGITNMRCGDCLFFQGGECQIVEGRIDEDDVCDQFEQNTKDGNVSAEMATQLRERPLSLLDMWITRVSEDKRGVKRWFATSSGVKLDLYEEKMSVRLFDDFVVRIERGDPAPAPFISDAWQGGLPYLGIAHYLDLNGAGIIGPSEAVWVDNKVLKMKGTFAEDSPLAIAAYEAIQKDRLEKRADQDRVRVSIAFIDWGHNHNHKHLFARRTLRDQCMFCEAGVRDKEYTAGQLVHLALTRRPAYPDTEIVALEERAMSKRREDAASIVGEELADDLEKRNKELIGRATDDAGEVAAGAIVIKDDSGGEKVSGESVERTLGGAQTLDDAEAFLTASANGDESVLLDSWEILATVLGNLAGEESQDAIRVVLKDFQSTLDVQTAEAVLEINRVLGGETVSDKTEKAVERQVPPQFRKDDEEEKRKRRPEEEEVEGELEAEEDEDEDEDKKAKRKRNDEEEHEMKKKSTHVLDTAFAELREAYDEAIETPGEPVMKFAMIQDSYKGLGAEIQARVAESVESAPVSAAAIARAVSEAIAPLQATVGALQAQIQSGATTKSVNSIPNRRAMKMPPVLNPSAAVVRGEVDLTPTVENETPGLRKIIRASTIGYEQRSGGR